MKYAECGLIDLIKIFEYNRPLHFFGGIGVLMFGIGGAIAMDVVNKYETSGALSLGLVLLMSLLFIIGIFTTFTGIILHSIAQLFKRSKIKD